MQSEHNGITAASDQMKQQFKNVQFPPNIFIFGVNLSQGKHFLIYMQFKFREVFVVTLIRSVDVNDSCWLLEHTLTQTDGHITPGSEHAHNNNQRTFWTLIGATSLVGVSKDFWSFLIGHPPGWAEPASPHGVPIMLCPPVQARLPHLNHHRWLKSSFNTCLVLRLIVRSLIHLTQFGFLIFFSPPITLRFFWFRTF